MSWWKIFRSNKAGKVPTINDIDFDTIAVNRVDGKLFFKRMLGGIQSIVEFTGAGPGLGESHLRAHQIDSLEDHPPVPEEKRGKWAHSNAETGAIEFVDLPAIITEELSGEVNNVNTVYTTSKPYRFGSISVFVNGLKEFNFSETDNTTITLHFAPQNAGFFDRIEATYSQI